MIVIKLNLLLHFSRISRTNVKLTENIFFIRNPEKQVLHVFAIVCQVFWCVFFSIETQLIISIEFIAWAFANIIRIYSFSNVHIN